MPGLHPLFDPTLLAIAQDAQREAYATRAFDELRMQVAYLEQVVMVQGEQIARQTQVLERLIRLLGS